MNPSKREEETKDDTINPGRLACVAENSFLAPGLSLSISQGLPSVQLLLLHQLPIVIILITGDHYREA